MTILSIGAMIFWTLAAAGVAWYLTEVAKEVHYVTLADGRRTERAIPILYRALLPFVGNMDALVARPLFARQVEKAAPILVSAGFEGVLSASEFVAIKLLMLVVFVPLALVLAFVLSPVLPDGLAPLLAFFLFAFAYVQPLFWLRGALKKRHLAIQRALPFVLDILTLSVEAGMDFIGALQRNCQSRKLDPLNEELLRMTKEIQIGASRKVALRNMAERVRQGDLKAVAFALIQADELGVSIGSILRIQADQLRARRFDRAEKLAAEAPVKMLGPLMLCIFPAVFIILMGPVLSQAMKGFF